MQEKWNQVKQNIFKKFDRDDGLQDLLLSMAAIPGSRMVARPFRICKAKGMTTVGQAIDFLDTDFQKKYGK